jgi:hypothetical protein
MNKETKLILSNLKNVVFNMASEWNNKKLMLMEELFEQSFEDYFKGRQTQEKTKVVAPILDTIFFRSMKTYLPNFCVSETRGLDYTLNNVPFESKISFSDGSSWTGNGYQKTPLHVLMKFNLSDNGKINGVFACVVNLLECKSSWTEPKLSSNFSQLKFLLQDVDKLNIAAGNVDCKLNSSLKYLKIKLESV